MKKPVTYADSGVDIEKGDRFAGFIASIKSKAVGSIGGFAGGVELDVSKYRRPVMLSCTDGVGTKLLVARRLGKYDTVGIDLVAMNVNDLVVCGAAPIVFLDYVACGKMREEILHPVIRGIVDGCEQAECTLAGGETAEMPDLYGEDDIDLAGFSVGLVEKDEMLPRTDRMEVGDFILGLPSSGLHSNGYSLARKAVKEHDDAAWREMLTPTKIYVRDMKCLLSTGEILGAAHITGGGLAGNIVRALPAGTGPKLYWNWKEPEIFAKLRRDGGIVEEEMRKVFNLGVGMAMIVKKGREGVVISHAAKSGIPLSVIGEIERG